MFLLHPASLSFRGEAAPVFFSMLTEEKGVATYTDIIMIYITPLRTVEYMMVDQEFVDLCHCDVGHCRRFTSAECFTKLLSPRTVGEL
jgi:hypothetical protein